MTAFHVVGSSALRLGKFRRCLMCSVIRPVLETLRQCGQLRSAFYIVRERGLIDEVCDINRGVGVAWFSSVGEIAVYRYSLLYINATPLSTSATVVERSTLISPKAVSSLIKYIL